MPQIAKRIAQGRGLAPVLLKRAATVTLSWSQRAQGRFEADDDRGNRVTAALADGGPIRGGDVLVADDGSLLRVQAAPQALQRVSACPAHGTPADLVRAAYRLGGAQVPVQLAGDHLLVEPGAQADAVLGHMHLIVQSVEQAFEPETAADAGCGHGHDHGHEHGHGHHSHDHGHRHT